MNTINITSANEFLSLLDTNTGNKPIKIVNKDKNAVMVSKKEWRCIEETLYLSNIPGFVEKLNRIYEENNWDELIEDKL